MKIGDIIMFREGHKNEGKPGVIEAESQTGSFTIRMADGTVCGAYPNDIFPLEEEKEVQKEVSHNPKPMYERQEIFKTTWFKVTFAIIIVVVTVLYFRGPNTSISIEQSPIDQKTQLISQKELSKGSEYKIQKQSREKQRAEKKIEQESVARVKSIDAEISKLRKEAMELIK